MLLFKLFRFHFKIVIFHYYCLLLLIIIIKPKQTQQQCLFEYNSTFTSQGEIYSPNYPGLYPNNLNCRYEFNGRDNELIILQVDDFQLELPQSTSVQEINFLDLIETETRINTNLPTIPFLTTTTTTKLVTDSLEQPTNDNSFPIKQCFYDFLDIFTVDKQGRTDWRSRHCGTSIDSRIVSTSPNLVLVFQTDRMLNYRGFKFRFHFSNLNIFPLITQTSICGSSQIEGSSGGQLRSPNYPWAYPSNAECAWVINVASHQTVLIKFDELNLSLRCKQSFVRIYDGYVNDINKPDLSVCEKLKYYHKGIQTFYSKTNRVVINFVANKALTKEASSSSLSDTNNNNNINNNMNDNNNKLEKLGFQLTWTAVHLEEQCDGFRCKGGEYCIDEKNFLCQQTYKYCIAKELTCDGSFNCDIGDKSDETFCQLKLIRLDLLLGSIAAIILFLFFSFILIFYVNTKIKRRNYLRRLSRYRRSNDIDIDLDIDYRGHITSKMPMPEFIDFTNLATTPTTIINENTTSANNISDNQILNNEIIPTAAAATTTRIYKKTRNSFDLSNKNDPINKMNSRGTILQIKRDNGAKEQWYQNGRATSSTTNTTRLIHQNSIPTNSSSLNSIKSADSISSPDMDNTDNSNNSTDNNNNNTNQNNRKIKKSTKTNTSTLPVKLRSKSSHSTNSLRRNSYTKVSE